MREQIPSTSRYPAFVSLLRQRPDAVAQLAGSPQHQDIRGTARFYQTRSGVLVAVELWGLPKPTDLCHNPIFALHIHDGTSCSGNDQDPFANAMTHFNPYNCLHPYHAGDLPPVFATDGYAFQVFLTNRFRLREVLGRTVILHGDPDDFTTQPSGNSGPKIACGVIRSMNL